MLKTNREYLDVAEGISSIFRSKINQSGYSPGELGRYLAETWGTGPLSAGEYISKLKSNGILTLRDTNNTRGLKLLQLYQTRIPNLIAALNNFTDQEKLELLEEIRLLRPGFTYTDSDVKPYERKARKISAPTENSIDACVRRLEGKLLKLDKGHLEAFERVVDEYLKLKNKKKKPL